MLKFLTIFFMYIQARISESLMDYAAWFVQHSRCRKIFDKITMKLNCEILENFGAQMPKIFILKDG